MPKRRALHTFWDEEDCLSVFLWLLLIFVFLIGPVSYAFPKFQLITDVFFALVLISGITTSIRSPKLVMPAIILVVLSVVTSVAEIFGINAPNFIIFSKCVDVGALGLLLIVILSQTLKDGPITSHRVKGAMATYVVLAILWAKLYYISFLMKTPAFSGLDAEYPFLSLIHFSFVTLTTVGYGDIVPTNVFTRTLADAEALIGQLFPAVFIARLVSQQIASGNK